MRWRWRWQRVAVAGRSMAPTLAPGDWLVVRRGAPPRRGDVVVVRRPERLVVKRVRGGPGDEVAGRVLGPGEWWVEGDDPAASDDSRVFGPVPAGAVAGRVLFRYWPRPGRVR